MRRFSIAAGIMSAAVGLLPATLQAQEQAQEQDEGWAIDLSVYMLGAGMDGTIGMAGNEADIDVSFEDILENPELGGMGSVRATRGNWAFTTEVIYMALGGSRGPVSADVDQWTVEPSATFLVSERFETIVGARYNNLSTEIRGPFGRDPSGTVDWWDPIIGARMILPMGDEWSFNLRGDIGGFGIGSELTWQVFPWLSWQFGARASMQVGYRWISVDYDEGSGLDEFVYDVVTQGVQAGVTFRF